MIRVNDLSRWAWLSVTGLVLTAVGMLVQIASGSDLYPSLTGPIVLFATAVFVALGPVRWTPFAAVIVPLVLGIGAVVAAAMTGEFIDQVTTTGNAGIVAGSLMHLVGLPVAVIGGVGMLMNRPGQVGVER
jgi:hypothetical protein